MANSKVWTYLSMAGDIATRKSDKRTFRLGAVGLRRDGTLVSSSNGPVPNTCLKQGISCEWHAEGRVSRKLDVGATIYVARVARDTGDFAMAKPCALCQHALRNKGVKEVWFTTGPSTYERMAL